MKIVTWNVNSLNVRLPHVLDFLHTQQPDILALQETKLPDERFPIEAIETADYHVCFSGQKTYNGVAIISRQPATDVITDIPDLDDPQRRVLATTIENTRIINVYIPNGQEVDSEKYAYKFRWLSAFKAFLGQQIQQHKDLMVLGDFNIAPNDMDVYNPKRWQGKIMCSDAERAVFNEICALGLTDTVRLTQPDDPMYSWWDYRMNAFPRGWGIRIDHILATQNIHATDSGVDTDMRARERPSDHAPVWMTYL